MSTAPTPLRGFIAVTLWTVIACVGAFIWFFQDTPLLNQSVLASTVSMDPARMKPDTGRAFIYPSRWFGHGDDVGQPRSAILLFEDGAPLTTARAKHDLVRGTGGGAWSHWTTSIFFSSTDGSDPRTNGRRYVIRGLTLPVRWGSLLVALVAVAMALRAVIRLSKRTPTTIEAKRASDGGPAPTGSSTTQTDTKETRPPRSPLRRASLAIGSVAVGVLLVLVLLGMLEIVLRIGASGAKAPELRLAAGIGWERTGAAARPIPEGVDHGAASFRVLFTGDSFAHDKTWADKTIAALRAQGIDAVGFEAGVSGYGTTQTYMQLRTMLPQLKPDAVVLLFYGWNDLRDNWPYPAICYNPRMTLRPYMDESGVIHEPSSLAISIKRFEIWKEVLEPVLDPMRVAHADALLASEGVDALARSRTSAVTGYDAEASWRPFYDPSKQDGPFVQGAWSVTRTAFVAIRDLCQAQGVPLIVVGIDNPFTVDQDVATRWLPKSTDNHGSDGNHENHESDGQLNAHLPMQRLGALMADLGISFVDAGPALRAQRDRLGGAKQYDGDPGNLAGHLLPEAEAALAESITPLLDDLVDRDQRRR